MGEYWARVRKTNYSLREAVRVVYAAQVLPWHLELVQGQQLAVRV